MVISYSVTCMREILFKFLNFIWSKMCPENMCPENMNTKTRDKNREYLWQRQPYRVNMESTRLGTGCFWCIPYYFSLDKNAAGFDAKRRKMTTDGQELRFKPSKLQPINLHACINIYNTALLFLLPEERKHTENRSSLIIVAVISLNRRSFSTDLKKLVDYYEQQHWLIKFYTLLLHDEWRLKLTDTSSKHCQKQLGI